MKENEVYDLSQKNNELSEAYDILQNNFQSASDEIQETKLVNKTLESNCKKHIENIHQLETKNSELQELLHELNSKYDECMNQSSAEEIRNLEKQIQKNEEEISSLHRILTIKEDDIKRIQEENKHLTKALDDERINIISLNTKVSKYNNLNNILCEENKQLKESIHVLETKLKNEKIAKKEDTSNNDKAIKKPISKSSKFATSKEQEALKLSDGNIVDFPEITNDATNATIRSIRFVYNDKGDIIDADRFFLKSSAEEISHVSRMLSEADIKNGKYWICGICRKRIKIAHRTYQKNKESLFFIHAQKNVNCPWAITANSSKDNHTEGVGIIQPFGRQ